MGKDVIMLLIEQIGMVLAYALNLKRAGMDEEALLSIDEYMDPLFDGNPDELTVDAIIAVLREMHLDDGPTVLGIVKLLRERGEILSHMQDGRCFDMYEKALRLAVFHLPDAEWEGAAGLIYGLYRQGEPDESGRILLAEKMERAGRYGWTEDIWYDCIRDYPSKRNRDLGIAFYDRLLRLNDAVLEAGGLPWEEVKEGKKALEATDV